MSNLIESLKDAVAYAKGDKSRATVTTVTVYVCGKCKRRFLKKVGLSIHRTKAGH